MTINLENISVDEKETTLKNLIEALQIFLKYGNLTHPTHCEHDILYICMSNASEVTDRDKTSLQELGFICSEGVGFQSFRYGSG